MGSVMFTWTGQAGCWHVCKESYRAQQQQLLGQVQLLQLFVTAGPFPAPGTRPTAWEWLPQFGG